MPLFFSLGADIATALMFFGLLYYLYRVSKARALWGAVQYGGGHLAYSLGSMICELIEDMTDQLSSSELWFWSVLGAVLINFGASVMLHGISRLFDFRLRGRWHKISEVLATLLIVVPILLYRDPVALLGAVLINFGASVMLHGISRLFDFRLRGRWHKISEVLATLLVVVPILLYRDPVALLGAMDISHCLLVATIAVFMWHVREKPYLVPARVISVSAAVLFSLYVLEPVLVRLGITNEWVAQYEAWASLDLALWMTVSYCVLMLASFRAMRAFVRTSREDPLTHALNRLGFQSAHEKMIANLPATEPLSVLAFDLDHFKHINDEFLHAGGDEVLKAFAGLLERCGRRTDVVARFGGEEFVLLMPGANESAAHRVAELVRERTEQLAVPIGEKTARFTTSVGVCTGRMGDAIDGLLAKADAALYRAKENGRNRVESANLGYAPTLSPARP